MLLLLRLLLIDAATTTNDWYNDSINANRLLSYLCVSVANADDSKPCVAPRYTHAHTHAHIYTHTHTHIHTHTYTYTYTHIHIHAYTTNKLIYARTCMLPKMRKESI